MKEDLTIIKYFILKHYQEIIEEPSNNRMAQYHYNWDQKTKQSEKIKLNIRKLEEDLFKLQIQNSKPAPKSYRGKKGKNEADK